MNIKPEQTNASTNQIPDFQIPAIKINLKNKVFEIIKAEDVGLPAPNAYCPELYIKKDDDDFDDENQYQNQQENQAQNKFNKTVRTKSRQLYLELCADERLFKAFEYESISQLNFCSCYPGAKISLTGEIDFSFDVFLLRPQNVSALGPIRQEPIVTNRLTNHRS